MHQVSSRLSKLALSVMLAFALVPTASVAAMADPQISDPASDPVIQSPSIDQGVSEEAPASTESWQGEGSEPAEADETAQPDSEAEASAAALGPDRQPVGFVYFDESSPSAGGSQLVVVALDDESIELTSAELTLTAPSGASVKATASEYAGNAALFSVDVPEAGEYRLERMEGASAADSRTLRRLTQPSNTWLPANSTVSGIETRLSSAWPRNRFVASEATRAPSTSAGMSTCSAEPS